MNQELCIREIQKQGIQAQGGCVRRCGDIIEKTGCSLLENHANGFE